MLPIAGLLAILPLAAPPDILISRQLLELRGLAVGDTVRLAPGPSGEGARRFRIAGVYEPTPDPERFAQLRLEARLHLPDLVDLTVDPADPEANAAVTAINVALHDQEESERFSRELTTRLPGVAAVSTTSLRNGSPFVVLQRFHIAISVITVIGSSAFLLALMVMRADERREVAGTLRLVGFSRRRVLVQALVEGVIIATAGALFGVLFAAASQSVLNAFFQHHYDTTLVFVRVTPGIAARAVATAVPLGVIAGLGASWALLRRDVVELLRR